MDAAFLDRLLGCRRWAGPCIVVLDSAASVKTPGPDSIVAGGQRSYAPRATSSLPRTSSVCARAAKKLAAY